jgi:hypothetical protein
MKESKVNIKADSKSASKKSDNKEIPTKPTDLQKEDLKGPVKTMKQKVYKAFQLNGKVSQGKEDDDNNIRSNILYTYNEDGRKLIDQWFTDNGKSYMHIYNNEGLSIEMRTLNADGCLEKNSITEYNEAGKAIVTNHFEEDASKSSKYVFRYDEKGNLTEMHSFMPPDVLYEKRFEYYDENDKRIGFESFKADGTFGSRYSLKTDDRGAIIEMIVYKEDGTISSQQNHTITYYENGKLRSYDGNNYLPDGYCETYEFELDEQGNWIKKIIFFKNVAVNVVLREITYFGDESSTINQQEKIIQPKEEFKEAFVHKSDNLFKKMGTEETKWLAEGSATPDIFNAMRYYVLKHNDMPSEITFSGKSFEAVTLMKLLQENMGAEIVHTYSNKTEGKDPVLMRYTLSFPGNDYLLQATNVAQEESNKYVVPGFMDDKGGYVYTSPVILFQPSIESGNQDEEFEEKFKDFLEVCTLDKTPGKPVIYMVQVTGPSFSLKVHSVDDAFEIRDLDLNYGNGFEKFHNSLMERFHKESKGLVLFHGQPGTGKTYYIRHLLRTMAAKKKIVIYMPPNMVDHLVEPSFMAFISATVESYSKAGNFCVLLIEDAEPLLAQRHSETRIQGITNLLNMTDGLLNDMLNLQIICTFNVNVEKLDKALLRPGRLIARKEFTALPEFEANLLGQRLGVKHIFTKPATLSEIYARRKDKNTLIHEVE